MFPLRIRARSERSGVNDVPADLIFAARARFDSAAISSNVRDNQRCAEFRLARIQGQHATNLGKESRHQKAIVAGATQQPKAANHLAKE